MLLVWRMYIVWDRSRYVLIWPAISFLLFVPGSLMSCGYSIAIAWNPDPSDKIIMIYKILTILGIANGIAMCWYNTGMTCGRLWYMRRDLMKYSDRPNPYLRIITVLVESGMLYSLSMLSFLLFYSIPSNIAGVSNFSCSTFGV